MRWWMTNIFLTLSCNCSPEMKQIEVACHLMYADFPCSCVYTHEARKWRDHGSQCLSLRAGVASCVACTRKSLIETGGHLGNYQSRCQTWPRGGMSRTQ